MLQDFKNIVEVLGYGLEGLGVFVIVIGSLWACARYLLQRGPFLHSARAYHELRQRVGRVIIIGLEFMIAGDIIRTVVVTYTFESLGALAIIILIRSFLSMTLFLEIEGRWPWQPPIPEDEDTDRPVEKALDKSALSDPAAERGGAGGLR